MITGGRTTGAAGELPRLKVAKPCRLGRGQSASARQRPWKVSFWLI